MATFTLTGNQTKQTAGKKFLAVRDRGGKCNIKKRFKRGHSGIEPGARQKRGAATGTAEIPNARGGAVKGDMKGKNWGKQSILKKEVLDKKIKRKGTVEFKRGRSGNEGNAGTPRKHLWARIISEGLHVEIGRVEGTSRREGGKDSKRRRKDEASSAGKMAPPPNIEKRQPRRDNIDYRPIRP